MPREENSLPSPVKQIDRAAIADYLNSGARYTIRGITLYTKPTDILEVGFLIRRKAGNAVQRNKTRRLFKGLFINTTSSFSLNRGYLFLFHRSYYSWSALLGSINQLLRRVDHVA